MPLLTAIDEYDCAIRTIAIHARIGLSNTDPSQREAALKAILRLCEDVDENAAGILANATGAVYVQLYGVLR